MRHFLIALLLGSAAMVSCDNPLDNRQLDQFAEFGNSLAIGLSVNTENRVFVSFPNHDGNGNLALTEVIDGKLFPYPDAIWNTDGSYQDHFLRIQDIYVDAEDFLWVLDSQPSSTANSFGDSQGAEDGFFKLVKINTKTAKVEATFLFEGLDKTRSALNDVRVDTEKQIAYLSDPGLASIIVLDLQTEKFRSVLAQTTYTLADDITLVYNGIEMVDEAGNPFSSHVNSIALTQDFKYLYFKPINKQNLYRIETQLLTDEALTDNEIASKVDDMGQVGITHGMVADAKGTIYFSSSEKFNLSYITSDGLLNVLIEDANLAWADSFGIGSDGYLYFTCAQIQRLPQWNNGKDKTQYPYRAYKVKLP